MVTSISSLSNMENMLYGGKFFALNNQAVPNMMNNYMAGSYNYGACNPYMAYNPSFQMNPYTQNAAGVMQNGQVSQVQTPQKVNFTANDEKALQEFYKKENTTKQDWSGVPSSIAMMGMFECAQNMLHPINAVKAIKDTNKVFNLADDAIKAIWTTKPGIAQNAYSALNAVNRAAKPKWFFQKWFMKPIDAAEAAKLNKIMKDALVEGTDDAIINATETIKAGLGCDGRIPELFGRIKSIFTGKKYVAPTPTSRIAAKQAEIAEAVAKSKQALADTKAAAATGNVITKATGFSLQGALKQGLKEGKVMAIFGLIADAPKIISAYKDGGWDSALKQVAQSGARSVVDGLGWTVGRAAGTAIGTKVGTMIGTAICPGLGTAVGAIIGFGCAAIGSVLASKAFHAIVPTDEATKLAAEKATKTEQGRQQLLMTVQQKIQSGQEVDQQTLQAAQKLALQYGAVA